MNSLQLNRYRRASEDSRISSFNLRNIDKRCAILTFPTLEYDGQWRVVALPLQYFDHTNRFGTGTQPFRTRSLFGSNVQSQCRNQIVANKMTGSNEVSYSSSRKSKRNSRKKARRKGKHRKKHLCDVGSTESEVCAEYTCGSSASEICESSSGVVTSSHSQNISTCDIDGVISKSILPSQAQKFHEEHHTDSSEIDNGDQQLSRCQGDIERMHPSHKGSLVGIHQKDFSDMHDSLVLYSVSVGSNSEGTSSSAGHIVNDNGQEISHSEQPDSNTKKISLYHEISLCSISKTCDYTEGTKHGLARSSFDGRKVAPGKKDRQFKSVPKKLGSMGNLHSQTGIESGHSVWKRVQKNDVEKCNTELKKTSSVCSQLDVILKDAPLQDRNITALPITDDKRKVKNKVPRKLKRNVGPSSKQESPSLVLFV